MAKWGSPRQALAYLYSCQRGPGMSKLKWHDAPGEFHDPWDHVLIGALLYGPKVDGKCGVQQGSELDEELRQWCTSGGPRTARVRSIEDRMRSLMREHDIKQDPPDVSDLLEKIRKHMHEDGGHSFYTCQRTKSSGG